MNITATPTYIHTHTHTVSRINKWCTNGIGQASNLRQFSGHYPQPRGPVFLRLLVQYGTVSIVDVASMGPPSLGTVTVVFATMDSFPWNEIVMKERRTFKSNFPSTIGFWNAWKIPESLSGLKAQITIKSKSHPLGQKYRPWGYTYKQLRIKHKTDSCLFNQTDSIHMNDKDTIT